MPKTSNILRTIIKKFHVFLIIISLSTPSTLNAQNLITPGTCELIVKSKPTLSSARAYALNISDKRFVKIFKSSNGWYAISIGSLKPHEVGPVTRKWKASGKIPSDSFCSKGKKYVAEYDWRTGKRLIANNRNSSGSSKPSHNGVFSDDEALDNTLIGAAVVVGLAACLLGACSSNNKDASPSKITFRNSCPRDDVKLYVHYRNTDDRWITRGPWVFEYGDRANLSSNGNTLWTKNSIIYYRAETLDGSNVWGGNQLIEYGDDDIYMREYKSTSDTISVNLTCDN